MCGMNHSSSALTGSSTIQQYNAKQSTTQVAGAHSGHASTGAGAAGADHHKMLMPDVPPKKSPVIQKYLADGSYGETVKKGKAKTIKIDDGKGFGNVSGRKQNNDDKKQNNYSVTDANFFPSMGVLNDVKTGKPMNYVKQIQAYNATGYISTFHPDVYQKMITAQNQGQGTVLGMALNLMGVDGAQVDPGMKAAGLTMGQFESEKVPGSPLQAKKVVMSGKDLSGQQWARPHHAESSWAVYKGLTDKGLDWKSSMIFSGDDAISGSGRMNGFNNQDGKDGFNDDEAAVMRMAAVAQKSTGIPVFDIVAGGHSHTGIDDSAKKNPNINKLIGLKHGDRSSSPQRLTLLRNALLDGTITSKKANVAKFDVNASGMFKGAGGNSQVLHYAQSQVAAASGDGHEKVKVAKDVFKGTNAVKEPVKAGGGAAHDPVAGAALVGGGGVDMGSIAAILQQLVQTINQLIQALSTRVPAAVGATGGGGTTAPSSSTTAGATQVTPPKAAAAHDASTHAH